MSDLAEGRLTRGELQRNARNICNFLLHTNAMRRLAGEDVSVTVLNRPADEGDAEETVQFYDLDGSLTIPLDRISTERGTGFAFGLTVMHEGVYEMTLTASSTASELAQIPVTVFSMGTASGTFTWNGTGGEPVSFTAKLPLYSHYSTMRLYFAQSGLSMHSIQFRQLSEGLDISALVNE